MLWPQGMYPGAVPTVPLGPRPRAVVAVPTCWSGSRCIPRSRQRRRNARHFEGPVQIARPHWGSSVWTAIKPLGRKTGAVSAACGRSVCQITPFGAKRSALVATARARAVKGCPKRSPSERDLAGAERVLGDKGACRQTAQEQRRVAAVRPLHDHGEVGAVHNWWPPRNAGLPIVERQRTWPLTGWTRPTPPPSVGYTCTATIPVVVALSCHERASSGRDQARCPVERS